MLTNNFYQAMRTCLYGASLYSVITTSSGSTQDCYPALSSSQNLLTAFSSNSVAAILFGTGAVPPSINDYKLSGEKISTISILARSATSKMGDESMSVTSSLTVKNTSTTDTIVINEMGVQASVLYASNKSDYCLVDRTVLDTPLTLAPGEQGVITYTFNLPIVQ